MNCWRHRWGQWSEPQTGTDEYGWGLRFLIQTRTCTRCNLRQTNRLGGGA